MVSSRLRIFAVHDISEALVRYFKCCWFRGKRTSSSNLEIFKSSVARFNIGLLDPGTEKSSDL